VNNNLVPTPIINANGTATTVYRKPVKAASSPAATTGLSKPPLTTEARIINAALALGISAVMAKRLGQKSTELDADASTAMLNLMTQPDPHGTVNALLIDKFGKVHAQMRRPGTDNYKNPDAEKFTAWVKHAEHHLHAVDALILELHPDGKTHHVTNLIIAGLPQHAVNNYTTGQLRDVALVTAAVSITRMDHQQLDNDLTILEFHSSKNYEYLTSQPILERITASHETAVEALRIITDEHVLTEAGLLHRLEGRPRALISGSL
jgi:hypothetical protein